MSDSIEDILKEVHASIGEAVRRKYVGRVNIRVTARYVEIEDVDEEVSVYAELTGLNPDRDGYEVIGGDEALFVHFKRPLNVVVAYLTSQLRSAADPYRRLRANVQSRANVPSKYLK